MALGAGLRFAVPDIHNLATTDWTNAIGAKFFGPSGQVYVVGYNVETDSKAAGVNMATLSASTNSTANTRVNNFSPYVIGTGALASNVAVGVMASSVASSNIGIVQVAGPVTVTLTAAAEASASNWYRVSNSTEFCSTSSANALSIAFSRGIVGLAAPIGSVSATTHRVFLLGSPWA